MSATAHDVTVSVMLYTAQGDGSGDGGGGSAGAGAGVGAGAAAAPSIRCALQRLRSLLTGKLSSWPPVAEHRILCLSSVVVFAGVWPRCTTARPCPCCPCTGRPLGQKGRVRTAGAGLCVGRSTRCVVSRGAWGRGGSVQWSLMSLCVRGDHRGALRCVIARALLDSLPHPLPSPPPPATQLLREGVPGPGWPRRRQRPCHCRCGAPRCAGGE